MTAAQYAAADRARDGFRDRVLRLLDRCPLLALPTVPVTAPLIGQRTVRAGDAMLETRAALLALTSPWNMAGIPAISVPAGQVGRLPVGVQLLAAPGNEDQRFRVASLIERDPATLPIS